MGAFFAMSSGRHPQALLMALRAFALILSIASWRLGQVAAQSLEATQAVEVGSSAEAAAKPGYSHEEMLEFARRFEAAAKSDSAELNALINWDAILDRAARGTALDEAALTNFKRGFGAAAPLAKEICETVKNDGSYHFLHTTSQSRSEYLLFRMVSNAGLNYHALLLGRDEAHDLRVVDMGVFVSGDLLSQRLHRAMLQSQVGAPPRDTANQSDRVGLDPLQIKQINEMELAQRQQKPQEALRIYCQLPQQTQREKVVLRLRCQITKQLNEAEYAMAMEDFRQAYPRDPALLMESLDYFFLTNRFPEAYRTISQLNALVEGDPYLDVLRASLLVAENKLGEARECVRRAINAEPDLLAAHWAAVTISLKQKDYRTTRRLLANIETNLGVKLTDLRGLEEYEGFVASPEHAAWLAGRTTPDGIDQETVKDEK